uniref:Uncharacterized protein n=1 Tax=Oryza glumipatula TaxID=40148 RepID=A0A0E0BBB3_9ORYZ
MAYQKTQYYNQFFEGVQIKRMYIAHTFLLLVIRAIASFATCTSVEFLSRASNLLHYKWAIVCRCLTICWKKAEKSLSCTIFGPFHLQLMPYSRLQGTWKLHQFRCRNADVRSSAFSNTIAPSLPKDLKVLKGAT